MLQTKSSAFLSLLLVFVSGGVVGTLVDRLYISTSPVVANKQQSHADPEEVRKRIVTEMVQEVKLDDQQVQQFQSILDDTRTQWMKLSQKQNAEGQALRDAQVERVKAILRPDQVPLYDALHAKHEAERAKHEAERKKQGQHHKGPPAEPPKSN